MHSQPHSRHVGALRGKIESFVLAPFFIGLTAGHTEPPNFHRSSRVATGGRQHCVLFQWKPQFGKSEEHRTGAQCEILMLENKIKIELTLAGRPEVRRQTTPASERHQRVERVVTPFFMRSSFSSPRSTLFESITRSSPAKTCPNTARTTRAQVRTPRYRRKRECVCDAAFGLVLGGVGMFQRRRRVLYSMVV